MTKTDYIPELSEVRMVRRAPEGPFAFTEDDRNYIGSCLAVRVDRIKMPERMSMWRRCVRIAG